VKCGSTKQALYAVDGEIKGVHSDSSLGNLTSTDIAWIQVVCMDPQDSTFRRGSGIPVVSVWTNRGPASRLEPTLAAILAAQDARAHRGLEYTSEVAELDLPEQPSVLTVAVEVRESGWMATASVERLLAKCFVFDGDVPAPHARLVLRQPECLDNRMLGIQRDAFYQAPKVIL
jgi:hypothetical protein